MMRSRTSLGRLYYSGIRTTPITAVTRTYLIPISYSTIVPSGNCSYENHYCRLQVGSRGFSQQAAKSEEAPDVGDNSVKASELPVSVTTTRAVDHKDLLQPKGEIKSACGDVNANEDEQDIDAMEQEDMFVEAHESFDHTKKEWGGPRRGGRLPEPTRFGDWERKGRCSDF